MRNRMVQKAMFSNYRAISLSPEAKWFLLGLMVAADDDGNVKLDSKWLKMHIVAKAGQTIDDLTEWIWELTEAEFLSPYQVDDQNYASIAEWKKKEGLTFQYIDKTKRQGWSNPTPDSGSETEGNGKALRNTVEPPRSQTSYRSVVEVDETSDSEPMLKKVKKPAKKLPKPLKTLTPTTTKGKVLKRPQKPLQRARGSSAKGGSDTAKALKAHLAQLAAGRSSTSARKTDRRTGTWEQRLPDWKHAPGGLKNLKWLQDRGVQEHELADAEDFLYEMQKQRRVARI